ncbi:hypothetical protein [Tenacibaculum aiptasiae]|uniref:hypothetical protein n=1 Tax=Tenacibaculum aiptasiae TaxID=426481 RepID=UPI003B5CE952
MKKKVISLKIVISLIGIMLLLNCEKEGHINITDNINNEFNYKTVSSEEILNFQKESNLAKKTENQLNLKLDFSDIKQEKIKNTSEFITLIPAKTKYQNIDSKVILLKQGDNFIKALINIIPDKNMSSKKFSGILSITHLNGKFINGYRIKKGVFITQFIKVSPKNKRGTTLTSSAPDEGSCDEGLNPDSDFCNNNLDEVVINSSTSSGGFVISIPISISNYSDNGPGLNGYGLGFSSGGGGGFSDFSGSSDFSNNVVVFPCDNPIHGCDKEECDSGFYKDVFGNCVEEDQIINKLTGKAKCIYNKLKNLKLYKTTIKKFENDTKYTLYLKPGIGTCAIGSEACTDDKDIDKGIITIYFPSHGNTNLDFAATVLHEGIHAHLFRYVNEHIKGVNPNDKRRIYELYFHYKKFSDPNYANVNFQHQYMREKYIYPIANAIRILDKKKYPLYKYLGFAWEGLNTDYGVDKYYDGNKWIDIEKTDYFKDKIIVNNTSKFNKNDCK